MLRCDWDSVSPSSITVQISEEFTGGNSSVAVQLGYTHASYGDGFTKSDGGVMCNFNGYALVSFSTYVRTTSSGVKQFYISKNGDNTVANVATSSTVATQLTSNPQLMQVSEGDVIMLYGRTWDNSVSFTLSTDSFTRMTVQKAIAAS